MQNSDLTKLILWLLTLFIKQLLMIATAIQGPGLDNAFGFFLFIIIGMCAITEFYAGLLRMFVSDLLPTVKHWNKSLCFWTSACALRRVTSPYFHKRCMSLQWFKSLLKQNIILIARIPNKKTNKQTNNKNGGVEGEKNAIQYNWQKREISLSHQSRVFFSRPQMKGETWTMSFWSRVS